MRTIALIAFLIMSINQNLQAQGMPVKYTTSKDSIDGGLIFKGLIGFKELNEEPTFDWYKKGVASYSPAKGDIARLEKELNKYSIVVIMGTWCDDSHNLVPKLYKVLEAANYPMNMATIYGADRAKTTGNGMEKTYNVKYVPAIILFDGTKEIGRITESVQKSVEADLVKIVEEYNKK